MLHLKMVQVKYVGVMVNIDGENSWYGVQSVGFDGWLGAM
jgi:hypothetical protein